MACVLADPVLFVVALWTLMASFTDGENLQNGPKLFYMNTLCKRRMGLAITDRKAIRLAPWNPPNKVPPLEDCVVPVSSHRYQNYQLMASLRKIEMSKAASSKLCHTARLDFYNGNTTLSPARLSGTNGICGKEINKNEYYSSTRNTLTLQFTTGVYATYKYEYFEAVITPFHTGHCSDDEFRCRNGRCVYKDLLCDGYNNCGDDSDEKDCKKLLLSIAAIIGIIVGCVVVVGIIITVIICKCCCAVCGYERL